MHIRCTRIACLALALSGSACSANTDAGNSGDELSGSCIPNEVVECACTDGSTSHQTCNAAGTFDPCDCGGDTTTGGSTSTGTGGVISTGGIITTGGTLGSGGVAGSGGIVATGGIAGSGGTGAIGGTGGTGGIGGSGGGGLQYPTALPAATQACPTLQTGNVNIKGATVQMWVGNASGGPVIFYWHATGSNSGEATSGLGQAAINEVTTNGGIIASFTTTLGTGTNTGNNVWYTGDLDVADEILACAIEQLDVDTRHIHAAGYSAGGLQTGTMAYLRSNYMASVLVYSGGALIRDPNPDPSNAPALTCAHGAQGSDVVIIDFHDQCLGMEDDIKARGGFAIDCDDGGSHISGTRFQVAPSAWQFFKDHPYKVEPEPYSSLPAGWPSYCQIH